MPAQLHHTSTPTAPAALVYYQLSRSHLYRYVYIEVAPSHVERQISAAAGLPADCAGNAATFVLEA